MIQRIQSIFLVLVLGIFGTLFFVPVYQHSIQSGQHDKNVLPSSMTNNLTLSNIPILLILMSGISLLAIVAIFNYKNRKRQMSTCRIGIIVSMLISLDALVFPQFLVHGFDRSVLQFGPGCYLLPMNIVLFAFAARFIKKDDDLVKAADRLR